MIQQLSIPMNPISRSQTQKISTGPDAAAGISGHRENRDVTNMQRENNHLTTETVEGAALSLESIDDVEGGDSLALGVLSVCDSVTDDTLEEGLEDTTGLFVDHC